MKKLLLTLALGVAFAFGAQGQTNPIQNPSFETFTGGQLPGWTVFGAAGVYNNVTINGNARAAQEGTRFLGLFSNDTVLNGQNVILRGAIGQKFAINYQPDSLQFYFMYLPSVATDKWGAYVIFTKHNTTTGLRDTLLANEFTYTGQFTNWTRLRANLTFPNQTNPDSAFIYFGSYNFIRNQTDPNPGGSTAFFIDNVSFITAGTVGVKEEAISLGEPSSSVYPNPFSGSTTISYNLHSSEMVNLEVYDAQGRLVSTLVNENKAAGAHLVNFDATGMEPGIYFYRLTTGDAVRTERMILAK